MLSQSTIYIIAGIAGFILLIFLFFFFKKRSQKAVLDQSLNMVLFLVKIPPKSLEELSKLQKQEKQWINCMDDFYSGLTGIRKKTLFGPTPWVSFEIAKVGEEIRFYVAASKDYEGFIEKQIYSNFPEAEVEKTQDFNIFKEKEYVVGGTIKIQQSFILPIRTYTTLETDPLSSLTHALTKLKEKEEAVIQIIIRNTLKNWEIRARKVVDEMSMGKNFYQALSATGLMSTLKGQDSQRDYSQFPTMMSVGEEDVIKAIKMKTEKDCFETNIRIIVSIEGRERAEEVFSQISNAFEIFSTPRLNSFVIRKSGGGGLKKLIYEYSFRTFSLQEKIVFSTEELTSIFHFPTPYSKTPTVRELKARKAPPPVELPKQGTLLGYNLFRGEKINARMERDDRRRHLYIIGQTGTGKSSLISNLILQDIKNGEGVGLLDPHGDLVEDILGKIPKERIDDVVLFDPSNLKRTLGLNFLEYDPNYPEQKTFIVNEMINILTKLYDLRQTGGPMFEQYTRNALLLLMDDPSQGYTLMEIPRVLSDKEFRHKLLKKCRNIVVSEFWEKEAEKAGGEASLANMVPYITSKFNIFIANDYMRPIIGQSRTALNFKEIMNNKKILLVNLCKGRLGDLNSSLLGLIIVGKLQIAAFARVDLPMEERKDFYLYMDEFQNFCTESIISILSEARKYRLCLIMSHQFIGQLPEPITKAVFGNVGSIMSFRIGSQDAEFLQKEFEPVFSSQDLINIDNFNLYVKLLIEGRTVKPFSIVAYAPEKSDYEKAKKIKEYTTLKYGRDREIVEREIIERVKSL